MLLTSICVATASAAELAYNGGAGYANVQAEVAV